MRALSFKNYLNYPLSFKRNGVIVVRCDLGLCNRMRVMDSAISFGKKYNKSVKVIWIQNNSLNCEFGDLFDEIENIDILNKPPLLYSSEPKWCFFLLIFLRKILINFKADKYEVKQMKLNHFDFNKLAEYRMIYLETFLRFFPSKIPYLNFKPVKRLMNEINIEIKNFNINTVGIHIRRADHIIAIQNSPIYLFELAISEEIEKDNNVMFYLCSDCIDTKKYLKDKYPEFIITYLGATDRNTKEGMERAIIELYSLSKTIKVYGSKGSSFSHTACHISGIPEIEISI